MRLLLVIALSALTGCSTLKRWVGMDGDAEPLPPPAEVPKQGTLNTIGEKVDKADARVASAVTVMVENKDKPAVVEAEGKLALSYLPKPSPEDVAFAQKRAAAADQKAYDEQMKFAKDFVQRIEKEWAEAVTAAKKNAAEVEQARTDVTNAKADVAKLKAEVERLEAEGSRNLWTMAGVGLGVVGALCTAFLGPRIGLPLLACGALMGSVPFIYSSPWFSYVLGGTLAFCAVMLGWWVWDKVRDSVNASDNGLPKEDQNP